MKPLDRSSLLNHSHSQRGQSLVEFALVLTLLLVLAAGAVDLGRVFHSTIIITNASREGARYLTRNPNDAASTPRFSGTKNAAIQEANGPLITITQADVTVLPDVATLDPGANISVTVQYSFRPVMTFILPDPIIIRRTTQMMIP